MGWRDWLNGVITKKIAKYSAIRWGKLHNNMVSGRNSFATDFIVFLWPEGWMVTVHPRCPEGKRYCNCREYKMGPFSTPEEAQRAAEENSLQEAQRM